MQSHVLVCRDVSWALHEVQSILVGGRYGEEFYETTPPLFLYLYSPAILLAKIVPANLFTIFTGYIFILAILSFGMCYLWIKKIFIQQDKKVAAIFMLLIAVTFFLLPLSYDFGQREHLLIILTMPYLLLMAYRLQKNEKINNYAALLVGLLGFLGFVIKPFFLLPLLFMELYYIFCKRHLYACLRIELIIVITLLIVYALGIYFFYQEYIFAILPLAMRYYYQGYGSSLPKLLINPVFLFCGFALLFYYIQLKSNPYKNLSVLLFLELLGFIGCYFMQHTDWYYHVMPAYSAAFLLLGLLFCVFLSHDKASKTNYILLALVGFIAVLFFLYFYKSIWTVIVLNPLLFFSFFTVLIFVLLSFAKTKRSLLKVLVIVTVSFIFSYLIEHDSYYRYHFSATLLLLSMLFFVFLPSKGVNKFHFFFTGVLGALIFAFPFYQLSCSYYGALEYKEKMNNLIIFMHNHANHQPVYFFSTKLSHEFPTADYAEVVLASRYPALVWLPGMLKKSTSESEKNNLQRIKDRDFFIDRIADEINVNKPSLVFVDVQKNKAYIENISIEYINYFSQSQKFKNVWKRYKYLTTIESPFLYKFQVYQRLI
ncbi:MAG: hypothetical protein ACYCQI_07545 [Gammaproteobacteria bacterium]